MKQFFINLWKEVKIAANRREKMDLIWLAQLGFIGVCLILIFVGILF